MSLFIVGGSGFVGQALCRAGVEAGHKVISLSRRGPPLKMPPWASFVQWEKGDVFKPETWEMHVRGSKTLVACVGGFGNNEWMRKINGDANIIAVRTAKKHQVPFCSFVSAHRTTGTPSFFLPGYFEGKARAEEELRSLYPERHLILRPGAVFGPTRYVQLPGFLLPVPMPRAVWGSLQTLLMSKYVEAINPSRIPLLGALLSLPVAAEDIGLVISHAMRFVENGETTDPLVKYLCGRTLLPLEIVRCATEIRQAQLKVSMENRG